MSSEEIVFGEVTYREPHRTRRPDRDARWACITYDVPAADDLPIFLDLKTADAIERHALGDTAVELGGILLGKECLDDQTGQPFVWISHWLEAKHFENTQASFTYTHESWEEISRERERRHPELDIVGWYHTHPDFGVFLSSHDLFIQRHFFGQPLQVAYVVDPIRQARGFFQWRGDAVEPVGGFHLVADRSHRAALARFVNDLEQIPNTDGNPGLGGLSPRLEAELIAMLTRTSHTPPRPSATEQARIATVFSLLGVVLGVLGVAAVLWLNTLAQQIQEQTNTLQTIQAVLADQPVRVTAAQLEAKEQVLDHLIGTFRTEGGRGPSERFASLYTEALSQRDDARTRLANQTAANDALAATIWQLQQDTLSLQTQYEQAAKERDELQSRVTESDAALKRQEQLLRDLEGGELLRKYNVAWYLAAVGWGLTVLLGLGLVSLTARLFPEVTPPSQEDETDEPQMPPHRIT